jgi:hypothetical protein
LIFYYYYYYYLAEALCGLTFEQLATGLQVTDSNILVGLEDRLEMLHHLGQVLQNRSDFFGGDVARPGNLMGTQKNDIFDIGIFGFILLTLFFYV